MFVVVVVIVIVIVIVDIIVVSFSYFFEKNLVFFAFLGSTLKSPPCFTEKREAFHYLYHSTRARVCVVCVSCVCVCVCSLSRAFELL